MAGSCWHGGVTGEKWYKAAEWRSKITKMIGRIQRQDRDSNCNRAMTRTPEGKQKTGQHKTTWGERERRGRLENMGWGVGEVERHWGPYVPQCTKQIGDNRCIYCIFHRHICVFCFFPYTSVQDTGFALWCLSNITTCVCCAPLFPRGRKREAVEGTAVCSNYKVMWAFQNINQ